jgi:hypothetical protein
MNAPAETRPTEATVSAYETLRRRCLESPPRVDGELGLSVLLRHGLLAWSRTCLPVLNAARTRPASIDTARVPSPLRDGIIDVMVTMTTSVSRSVHNGALHA